MARILPFRAFQYSGAHVDPEKVTTQPYDKISPEMERQYLDRDPHNIVRIIRPQSNPPRDANESVYAHAAGVLEQWKQEGVIRQAQEPLLFAYYQRFRAPDTGGQTRTRKGFVCLTALEEYDRRVVFPHERTLSGPKQDRLELLRHTRTHFGQVFLLYSDPESRVDGLLDDVAETGEPLAIHDEYDVEHCLWPVRAAGTIGAIRAEMAERELIIADGHHRYETALAFRDEERRRLGTDQAAAHDWVMTTLVNMDSPGMSILPTHRVLSGIEPGRLSVDGFVGKLRSYFDVSEVGPDRLGRELEARGAERPSIGVVGVAPNPILLQLRRDVDVRGLLEDLSALEAGLDVVVLHRLVFERCLDISAEDVGAGKYLQFVRGLDEAVGRVGRDAQAAFLLNPTRLEQVRDIALAGGVMPQKSTDFFPKLLSGLTMYSV